MAKAIHILRLADDFESKLTPEGEPYYEPYEDVDIGVDPHAARRDLEPRLSRDVIGEGEYRYRGEEDPEEAFDPGSISPPLYRLSEEELKRATRLIHIIWFEAEIKVNINIKNATSYMEQGGIPESITLNFKDLAKDISKSMDNLKKLGIWSTDKEFRERHREKSAKSALLHEEISNLSSYISGLSDMHSLFADYYLYDMFIEGKDDTTEYRMYSMASRSVDKIKTLLELGRQGTLESMQHKKYMGGGKWSFE